MPLYSDKNKTYCTSCTVHYENSSPLVAPCTKCDRLYHVTAPAYIWGTRVNLWQPNPSDIKKGQKYWKQMQPLLISTLYGERDWTIMKTKQFNKLLCTNTSVTARWYTCVKTSELPTDFLDRKHLKEQNPLHKYPLWKRTSKIHSKAHKDKQFDWHASFIQKIQSLWSFRIKTSALNIYLALSYLTPPYFVIYVTWLFTVWSWISCLFCPK